MNAHATFGLGFLLGDLLGLLALWIDRRLRENKRTSSVQSKKQVRIVFGRDEFHLLVAGEVVRVPTNDKDTEALIILSDIGFDVMQTCLDRAKEGR